MKVTKKTHILLVVLVVLIVFIKSLENGFSWDDYDLILTNPYIKSAKWVKEIFTGQLYEGSEKRSDFYRPAQLLSYIVEYSVWKLNPFGFHLTNLLLHISNSIFLYLILVSLGPTSTVAFFASLLFGIAPMISGITYYISARSDLMAVFFIFSSILCFLRYCRRGKAIYYPLSVLFFIFSILSKEMALIFPFLLILIFHRSKERAMRLSWIYLAPYFMVALAYGVARMSVLNFSDSGHFLTTGTFTADLPLHVRLMTDIKVLARYITLFLYPHPLHMEWFIRPVHTLFDRDVLTSALTLIFFAVAIKRLALKNRMVLFGFLWFIIALLPVLNIYPISVFFGEGWLYLPSVGIFIIMGIFFTEIIGARFGKGARDVLFILFLAYYSVFTFSYSRVWKDSVSLFTNILKYEKGNPFIFKVYNNLGMAYYRKGEYKKSIEYCKESIASNPGYKEAYNNLGVSYIALKRYVKSIGSFKKAIKLDKRYTQAYNNLGHAYAEIGLDNKALKATRKALSIDPAYYSAYLGLGFLSSKKKDFDSAIQAFKNAKSLRPYHYEPYLCLGDIYIKKGRFKEALIEYENIPALVVVDHNFYNTMAFLYIKNQRLRDAEAAFRHSLALENEQREVHNNLGNIYSSFGDLEMAIEHYKSALSLEPENPSFLSNLRQAYDELHKKTLSEAKGAKDL